MGIKYYTVIFPFNADGSKVLLGLKKRGMGEGLWNGFGGKPEPGESMEECARRELKEECGIDAAKLTNVGVLLMSCIDGRQMTIFVYTTSKFSGDIVESEEMRPQWFGTDSLTYDKTYQEAKVWWPAMLAGKTFVAWFEFGDNCILSHEVAVVKRDQLDQHLPVKQ